MPSTRQLPSVLGSLLLLSACVEGIGPAREKVGFISAPALDAGGGAVALRPLGAFYRADGLSLGIGDPETCVGLPFSNLPPTVANLPTLSAGEYLVTTLSGRTDTLFQTSSLGLLTYQLLTSPSIPFTPGDTLRLDIEGEVGGFPGTTLRVRTAEAFTFDPVGNPAEGQPLTITWTAAPSAGSLMTFSLRLNNTGTSEMPDAQIYCVFNDDGSGQVPAALANVWRNSAVTSRSVRATRVRYTTHEFDGRTRVTLLSYYDQPLDPLVTP